MKWKLIWVIIALGFLLRMIALTSYPAGFNADEASFGYDAYSILQTGSDQWGSRLPLVLKSFGDFKSPLYTYLSLPFVAAFGLNIFSVRLTGAIVGTLAILSCYLLAKKFFKSELVGVFAAALIALNPWSVMLSRGAFESNLITFFLPMAIYLFLEKKYVLSSFLFGISLFTYHSAKVITPVVIVAMVIMHFDELKKIKLKKLLLPILITIIFQAGLIYSISLGGGVRIAERSITQGALLQGFDDRMKAISEGANPKIAKILNNKYSVIFKRFFSNYRQYFSYKYLINKGAGEGSYGMIPGIGVLNLIEIIAFAGIIPLALKRKYFNKTLALLIFWLLMAPLPAALASGIGYAGNRASGMLPVIQIIAAAGILGWAELIKKYNPKIKYSLIAAIFILAITNIISFAGKYFTLPKNDILRQMGYGYVEIAEYLGKQSDNRNILISRSLSEPQIFLAFALKMDPKIIQKETINWDLEGNNVSWVDQLPVYKLGRFTVKSIDWNLDSRSGGLIVVRGDEKIPGYIPFKTFNFPDGSPNVLIIDSNQKIYAKSN